ncbi:MAG: zinc ribbon domain-containing protein [Nitrososphaerota archaeon]|nr:zinc ribbon domain-containing protein [Nitrososphaerota archaeon]
MGTFAQMSILLLIASALIFAILLRSIQRAYRITIKRFKTDYGVLGSCCFMIFGNVIGILGYTGLSILIVIAAFLSFFIVSAFATEKQRDRMRAVEAEDIRKVDVLEPIRFKDFFNLGGYTFLLKLDKKYGERKALAISTIRFICLTAIIMPSIMYLTWYIMSLNDPWLHKEFKSYVLLCAMIPTLIITAANSYRNEKKILKRAKNFLTTSKLVSYDTNFCANCGTSIKPGTAFCTNCGKHID